MGKRNTDEKQTTYTYTTNMDTSLPITYIFYTIYEQKKPQTLTLTSPGIPSLIRQRTTNFHLCKKPQVNKFIYRKKDV